MRKYFAEHPECEGCGASADDVHHLRSRAALGKAGDVAVNFVSLCRGCHGEAHAMGGLRFMEDRPWLAERLAAVRALR